MQYLEFEKPLADIEGKAEELRAMAKTGGGVDMSKEAEALDRKADAALRDLYKNLSAWQKCQVARHPDRPHCLDRHRPHPAPPRVRRPAAGLVGGRRAALGRLARPRRVPAHRRPAVGEAVDRQRAGGRRHGAGHHRRRRLRPRGAGRPDPLPRSYTPTPAASPATASRASSPTWPERGRSTWPSSMASNRSPAVKDRGSRGCDWCNRGC